MPCPFLFVARMDLTGVGGQGFVAAGGWLVDISQSDYDVKVIDVDQPSEAAAAARGSPVLQTLDFRVA